MDIPALSFSTTTARREPHFCTLTMRSPASLDKIQLEDSPRVFVIQDEYRTPLIELDPRIKELKRKHPSVELFKRHKALADGEVSLIPGGYQPTARSLAQMQRSIRTLLDRLAKDLRRNICFISVDDAVFDRLREQIEIEHRRRQQSAPKGTGRRTPGERTPYHEIVEALGDVVVPDHLYDVYVGESDDAQFVRQLIVIAGRLSCPVLIQGESGTGKERVARAIHEQCVANRPKGVDTPFRAINCGAIPGELLESELFGCEPGAHNTALERRLGVWRSADRGTLFLDEIGELRIDHQVKVLRALQESLVRPVGGDKEVRVNTRIIAATNRDLDAMVRAGRFREDLYYRLRMFFVPTTPLRDHPEDVPVLAQYFWKELNRPRKARLTRTVMRMLTNYTWPGNARELQGVLMSIASLFPGKEPTAQHVKWVMGYLGKGPVAGGFSAGKDAARTHRYACLRHLRRADEALRALELTLGPLKGRGSVDADFVRLARDVRQRHVELARLCGKPLLFGSATVYKAMENLLDKVETIGVHVANDLTVAARYWRAELKPEIEVIRPLLFEQVQRLTG